MDDLEEACLTRGETTSRVRNAGGRSAFTAPRIVGQTDISIRVRATSTVAARVSDGATKAVEGGGLTSGVQAEARVGHVARCNSVTGVQDAERVRRGTRE